MFQYNLFKNQKGEYELSFIQNRPNVKVILEEFSDLSMYPNPASDELNVLFDINTNMQANIQIIDITGKIIQNHVINVMLEKQKKLRRVQLSTYQQTCVVNVLNI